MGNTANFAGSRSGVRLHVRAFSRTPARAPMHVHLPIARRPAVDVLRGAILTTLAARPTVVKAPASEASTCWASQQPRAIDHRVVGARSLIEKGYRQGGPAGFGFRPNPDSTTWRHQRGSGPWGHQEHPDRSGDPDAWPGGRSRSGARHLRSLRPSGILQRAEIAADLNQRNPLDRSLWTTPTGGTVHQIPSTRNMSATTYGTMLLQAEEKARQNDRDGRRSAGRLRGAVVQTKEFVSRRRTPSSAHAPSV